MNRVLPAPGALGACIIIAVAPAAESSGGVTFGPEYDLAESATPSGLNEISPQAVAVDGQGRVVVVWSEFPAADRPPELMARVRLADGSWSPSAFLTEPDGEYSGDAALATTADGGVAVAWVDHGTGSFEVRCARFDADRTALTAVDAVSDPALLVMEPAIAAGPRGELAVGWTSMVEMNYELRLRRRPAGGTWGPIAAVTTHDRRASDQISMAYGPDGRLHLAWADNRSGTRRILYGSLGAGKGAPPSEVWPDTTSAKQTRPSLTVDQQGRVHIAWMSSDDDVEEVIVASAREGGGFARRARPGILGAATRSPCLVAAANGLHLLWEDARHSAPEAPSVQIYYGRVGLDRMSEETPVTSDIPVSCFNPSLAVGPGALLHMVWRNMGLGEGDIFYREGMASGPWAPPK